MNPSIPSWFEEELEREFRGRLRIRWSVKRREWHIEEKVGRGVFDPPRSPDPFDDRTIRAKDGYRFFAAVQASSRRACPECHLPIEVPPLRFREVRCEYCGFKGLSGRMVLAYFPLGHQLLEHLRKHDPTKDRITQNLKEVDLHNERLELGIDRHYTGQRQDILAEAVEATNFASAGFMRKQQDYNTALLREAR